MASRTRLGSQHDEYRLCRVFATRAFGSLAVRAPTRRPSRARASPASVSVECPSKCQDTGSMKTCRAVKMELQLFAWKNQQQTDCNLEAKGSTTQRRALLGRGDVDVVVTCDLKPSAPEFESLLESSAPDFTIASANASAPEFTPRTMWACHCFCVEPSAPELDMEEAEEIVIVRIDDNRTAGENENEMS